MKHQALFTALTGLGITSGLLTLASNAQHEHDAYTLIKDKQCNSAVLKVHSDIENRLGGSVLEVVYADQSGNKKQLPVHNRHMGLAFRLLSQENVIPIGRRPITQSEASANISLVHSPSLVKDYAEQIVESCRNVGSVGVSMWELRVGWSVNRNMQLVQNRCVDYDTAQRRGLIWGEDLCV